MSSEWTVDTLKDHFDDLRKDDQVAIQAALSAAKEANSKAENAYDKRFEGVNEFRGTVNDIISNCVTRAEWSGAHEALLEKITELQRRADKQEGAKDQTAVQRQNTQWSTGLVVTTILGIFGTIGTIGVAIYLTVHH